MLSNAYLLAKFRFDTAENERKFAEILPKTDNYALARPSAQGGRRALRGDLLGLHLRARSAAQPRIFGTP